MKFDKWIDGEVEIVQNLVFCSCKKCFVLWKHEIAIDILFEKSKLSFSSLLWWALVNVYMVRWRLCTALHFVNWERAFSSIETCCSNHSVFICIALALKFNMKCLFFSASVGLIHFKCLYIYTSQLVLNECGRDRLTQTIPQKLGCCDHFKFTH